MPDRSADTMSRRMPVCLKVPYIPKRYTMALVAHIGVMWTYALRVNLSVALVAMVSIPSSNKTVIDECPGANNTFTTTKEREFRWSSELQGVVLGSFYYGYLLTQVVGGRLAEQFGGRRVFGTGLLIISLMSLLSPVGARLSAYTLIAIRVVEGLAGGTIIPAILAMLEKWSPISESARLNSFIVSGTYSGIVVSQLLAGVLAESGFLGGWPSVFYVMGIAGLFSSAMWFLVVTDTPSQHSTISIAEREYIEKTVKSIPQRLQTPWRAMATSLPIWAICVCSTFTSWGLGTMLSLLPTYIDQVLHFDIRDNGILSSLPYFVTWLFIVLGGIISDALAEKAKLPTVVVRKLVVCSGGISLTAFIVSAGYTGCDVNVNIAFLTLGIGLLGLLTTGLYINPHDLAPNYAATIFGISNTFGTVPCILAPFVAGYIIGDQPTQAKWRKVFLIDGALSAFGTVFYGLFGSGEIQPWSFQKNVSEKQQGDTTAAHSNGTAPQRVVRESEKEW